MKSEFLSRARVWSCSTLVLPNTADKTKSSGRQALPVLSVYILTLNGSAMSIATPSFVSSSSFMKTALLKSNLLIKPSIVLAAAVLTATSLLAPSTAAAADPTYLMPPGPDGMQPFDPNPAAPGSLTGRFMTYGKDSAGKDVPLKTLRITNDTGQTVYPIMRDPNHPPYDPYDDPNKEYRGYIGYEERGKYYFGLKKGESILVRIPLVFWNGGRIAVGTDGQYLTQEGLPLSYDSNAQRSIANAETSGDTIRDGVVMWYRAESRKTPLPTARISLRSGRFATTPI